MPGAGVVHSIKSIAYGLALSYHPSHPETWARMARLQSIECRLASEQRTVRPLAGQAIAEDADDRIVPQVVVIVDIFTAKRDAENALAEHRRKLVDSKRRIAAILETLGQARHKPDRLVGLAEQQLARVRNDRATIECAHNLAPLDGSKIQRTPVTLCRHPGVLSFSLKSFSQNHFR
jgi:hypothetical protein